MDGSCHRHTIRELSRAGWAVVMVSGEGELLGVLKGPLWDPWHQTLQGSEFGALAWTGLYAEGPSACFSDCPNVVLHQSFCSADVLSAKRQYSGLVLQARHHFGTFCRSFDKVSAHMNADEPGISSAERFRRRGNNYADIAAKKRGARAPADESCIC